MLRSKDYQAKSHHSHTDQAAFRSHYRYQGQTKGRPRLPMDHGFEEFCVEQRCRVVVRLATIYDAYREKQAELAEDALYISPFSGSVGADEVVRIR